MCDQSTACNTHRHIRLRLSTIKRCIGLIIPSQTDDVQGHNQTLPQLRNWHHYMTTRSSSIRCVSAVEHHTAEQCSKTGRTKPRKHLPRSNLSRNTRRAGPSQDTKHFLLWKPSKDASQSHLGIKCHSQYNKVIRLLQHCSANS